MQEITASRLLKDLLIQGNKMSGLLDTGADVSCIAGKDWPSSWPTCLTSASFVGIRSVPSVAKSSQILTWSGEKGAQGTFFICGSFTTFFFMGERYIISGGNAFI